MTTQRPILPATSASVGDGPPVGDRYQWQHLRIGDALWRDMPDPHPRSPLAALGPPSPGEVVDDGMGNRYRRVRVTS